MYVCRNRVRNRSVHLSLNIGKIHVRISLLRFLNKLRGGYLGLTWCEDMLLEIVTGVLHSAYVSVISTWLPSHQINPSLWRFFDWSRFRISQNIPSCWKVCGQHHSNEPWLIAINCWTLLFYVVAYHQRQFTLPCYDKEGSKITGSCTQEK